MREPGCALPNSRRPERVEDETRNCNGVFPMQISYGIGEVLVELTVHPARALTAPPWRCLIGEKRFIVLAIAIAMCSRFLVNVCHFLISCADICLRG
ncbi:hypothetical protein NL676_011345 [Syzygium grande]|nr:hypothetical protein NL676_011345 [Syzygium grande]